MNDRLDFENRNNEILEDKAGMQAEIDLHVAEFLAKGGKVEKIDYDHTSEILARVGQWSEMGSAPIESEVGDYEFIVMGNNN
jgi:hypothetical protein